MSRLATAEGHAARLAPEERKEFPGVAGLVFLAWRNRIVMAWNGKTPPRAMPVFLLKWRIDEIYNIYR